MSEKNSPSRRRLLGLGAGASVWLLGACGRGEDSVATPAATSGASTGPASQASAAVPSSVGPGDTATPTPSGSASGSPTPTTSASAGTSASGQAPAGTAAPIPGDPMPAGRPANVLLFGTDSREEGSWSGNNDVDLFMQVSADRTRVTLVSIPRDLWVAQPGHSTGKLTWALNRGGLGLLKQVVSSLMGVPIDYTMQTNFLGFIGLVNLFDGFSVNNPIASTALPDGTFVTQPVPCPKGNLTLHGNNWLAFVRQRKELPLGDLDRTRRHRATVIGMGTWLQKRVAANPSMMTGFVPKVLQNMKMTGGLTNEQLAKLGTMLPNIDASKTINLMYPVAGYGNGNGQSYVVYDKARAAEMKQGLAAGDLGPYVAKYGTSNAPTGGPRG